MGEQMCPLTRHSGFRCSGTLSSLLDTHTYTRVYTHACMHTHVHTKSHAHTHTHTHTHTQARTLNAWGGGACKAGFKPVQPIEFYWLFHYRPVSQ